ncbi:alcohol dehydrogenase catalytic domain-containing protein [Amycolatopsis acidiphila]|uniref:Zinc-binding dehydrogenase n=1 Tax=Amycolatopsis acidiphila TaxID=715473 RepID=A0A558ALL4_9PSEU|nr:alcohol dehydrogenase catalytic domain-containing protein [Amycolatopsis acidiphila]TVT25101.1 zinc-binding dehydrogenase [Amycolatopsis acidiphila]UIJ57386.1 alcohol dehydrogenase catalytic domain-containing protein [Amycolatopsis acidiphila]GHG84498.1 alcohol dehydrogenase [Amycolatopsis acidiphila]
MSQSAVTSAPAPSGGIPDRMRAAVLFGPGDLRVVERDVPSYGPDEVLVRVAMCGACGTDLKILDGHFPQTPPFGEYTPGHEWTGTIVAVGSNVDEFAPGDKVCIEAHRGCGRCANCVTGKYTACLNYGDTGKGHRATGMTTDGGFAEYAVHHVSALYRLPEHLSPEDAVLITTAGTGLYGLDTAQGYIVGQTVVVFGPGAVGLMTAQVCKVMGAAKVILVGTRQSRLDLGLRLGVDQVVNAQETDPVERVLELTGGVGPDLTIEASGGPSTPQQAVEVTKRGGKILFVAFYPGKVEFDLSAAIRKDITMYTSRGEGGNNVERAVALAASGALRGKELVTHHFPLEQIGEAFRVIREREGDPLKVVIVP